VASYVLEVMVSGAHDNMTEIKIIANVVNTNKVYKLTLLVITLATPASVGQDYANPKRRSDKRTVVTGQGN